MATKVAAVAKEEMATIALEEAMTTIQITGRAAAILTIGESTARADAMSEFVRDLIANVGTRAADGSRISNGGYPSLTAKQPTVLVGSGIKTLLLL